MCMWQSQALAGALSLGAAVPDEFGTGWDWPWARLACGSNAAAPSAAKPVACRNSRRPMVLSFMICLPEEAAALLGFASIVALNPCRRQPARAGCGKSGGSRPAGLTSRLRWFMPRGFVALPESQPC